MGLFSQLLVGTLHMLVSVTMHPQVLTSVLVVTSGGPSSPLCLLQLLLQDPGLLRSLCHLASLLRQRSGSYLRLLMVARQRRLEAVPIGFEDSRKTVIDLGLGRGYSSNKVRLLSSHPWPGGLAPGWHPAGKLGQGGRQTEEEECWSYL